MNKRKRFKLTFEIFKDIMKICPRVQGQDFDELHTDEEIMSFLRELGHTGEIKSLNDVVVDHIHQPWRTFAALINRSLSRKTTVPVDEDPKSAKKKVPTKKTTRKQTSGVVIRYTPVESSSKRKEKVDVASGKGIELLSEMALTEEAQYEEVCKKSLRGFHKTHLSGSGTVTKTAPSAIKIKPSITNEGTGIKPRVPDVTEEESFKSEAESWGNDEDDSNNDNNSKSDGSDEENDSDHEYTHSDSKKGSDSEHETDKNELDSESDQEENEEKIRDDEEEEDEFVRTPSNDSNDETKISDKAKGHEDEEMDHTTSQLYDDSISSFTPLPSQSTPTPPLTTEETNPPSTFLDFASVFQFNNRVTTLEKEVAGVKKNYPFKTQVTALVDEHLDERLRATRDEFMNFLLASITARITEQVKNC
nr:hypothetical protein [Tanacetum cinerariifolium]